MITADELRRVPLFAALPDNEAASLASRVADVRLRQGDWLIQEGEQPSFFLLLEGSLEVRKAVHGVERRLTQYNQGEYFGELPLLLGSPAVVSLRALEPSRVAQLDHADFRQLFSSCATLASELTRTMTQRVARLQALAAEEAPASVAIVGHRFDIACHHLRDFLARNRITFRWLDPTRPPESGEIETPRPGDRYPVVILASGERLVTPTLRELAEKLGLQTAPANTAYDLAIIGGWPGGSCGRCLWCVGRTDDDPDRAGSGRRPGRHIVAHRELPGVSHRGARRGAERAGAAAGAAVWRGTAGGARRGGNRVRAGFRRVTP